MGKHGGCEEALSLTLGHSKLGRVALLPTRMPALAGKGFRPAVSLDVFWDGALGKE